MTTDMSLSAAVIVVHELGRSEEFYRDVLGLEAVVTEDQAVLLATPSGDRLVLRALPSAPHASAGVGVQYLVWTAGSREDLDRCEASLKARDVLVSSRFEQEIKVVEGRDPDGLAVLVVYPGGAESVLSSVPARSYAY